MFINVITGMFPEPEVVYPVILPVNEAVQLYVVPVTFELKFTPNVLVPEHIVWVVVSILNTGKGLTMIVSLIGLPGQAFAVGVMV